MSDPDRELLTRWQAGDGAAGEALFERHFAEVFRFFEHKIGPEADELTQRTFAACLEARDRFRAQSTVRTYLFAIARNQLYSFLREARRAQGFDADVTSIAEVITSIPSRLERARDAERLRTALATLPAEQQLLLELHYWHDLDAAALAEVFELSPGSIRVRLTRARQVLRARLDEAGALPSLPAGTDSLAAAIAAPEQEAAPHDGRK